MSLNVHTDIVRDSAITCRFAAPYGGGVSKGRYGARYRHAQECRQNDGASYMDLIPDSLKDIIIPAAKGLGLIAVWVLGVYLYGYMRDKSRRR